MQSIYDFRTSASTGRATFVVAGHRDRWQTGRVLSQSEIIDALRREVDAKRMTQAQIARVLGVATNNANKLFNPAAKTGKPRNLTYDEGVLLIKTFGLDVSADEGPVQPMSVPVARLAVQYVAQQLGVRIDPDDERVEDLALDIQAYSELAASSQIDDNLDEARGWLRGRGSRQSGRP